MCCSMWPVSCFKLGCLLSETHGYGDKQILLMECLCCLFVFNTVTKIYLTLLCHSKTRWRHTVFLAYFAVFALEESAVKTKRTGAHGVLAISAFFFSSQVGACRAQVQARFESWQVVLPVYLVCSIIALSAPRVCFSFIYVPANFILVVVVVFLKKWLV